MREGYGAHFQAVIILLAIETGMPADAEAPIEALASGTHATLGEVAAAAAPDVEPDAWARFTAWVQAADRPDRRALRTDLFAQWTPLVGQFSFRVDGRGAWRPSPPSWATTPTP